MVKVGQTRGAGLVGFTGGAQNLPNSPGIQPQLGLAELQPSGPSPGQGIPGSRALKGA